MILPINKVEANKNRTTDALSSECAAKYTASCEETWAKNPS